MQDAFEMIMNRHRKGLFGDILAHHILIESPPNFCRFWHPDIGGLSPGIFVQLLIEDAFANIDATIADINAGAGDQLAHLSVALATEGAHGEVGSARPLCPPD